MDPLQHRTILLLSPQSWGTMFISKHHYAIELAARGNTVFFLNPPTEKIKMKSTVTVNASIYPGLWLVDHELYFPYRLKFHAMPLFHLLMKRHVKKVIRKIGKTVDIVWSFDLNNLYPFQLFPQKALKIFHPVDEPLTKQAIKAAKGADIMFSVTTEILEKYRAFEIPAHLINHGVTTKFIQLANKEYRPSANPRVGISGNLLRGDIDRITLLQIIREHPDVVFECWGSYKIEQSNVGGNSDSSSILFIRNLQQCRNVKLHGPIGTHDLADALKDMDAFLICYDIQKDQSGGTNYHKIMEYLGTGRVVVSNNVSAYSGRPDLIQMTDERGNNNELPAIFNKVIMSLARYNEYSLQSTRISFAAENTYQRQIDRISQLIPPNKQVSPR